MYQAATLAGIMLLANGFRRSDSSECSGCFFTPLKGAKVEMSCTRVRSGAGLALPM
jgi:hypothetical protein